MSKSIRNFMPERLDQALAARGWSAMELCARVGVTPTTISRWRNRVQIPCGDMLEKLANELRLSPEWLTRPLRTRVANPYFRGSVARQKSRALLDVRINWLDELAQQLEQYVDFPKVNIPNIPALKLNDITQVDIESAAHACRTLWGLKEGPVADVLFLLENAGVIVAKEETGTPRIEGLSSWNAKGRPLLLLCADEGNAYRSRFDAAHELGHLVLHTTMEAPTDAATHKLVEQQAHRFAGAFLLPNKGFCAEVAAPVSLYGLLFLKKRWGVDVTTMMQRLLALGVLSDVDYVRLTRLRSAKWQKLHEPNDDDRRAEVPRLLSRAVALLEREGVMTVDRLSSFFGLSTRDVEGLLSVPLGALSLPKADGVPLALKRKETASSSENDFPEPNLCDTVGLTRTRSRRS